MNVKTDISRIKDLLLRVPSAPNQRLPPGLTDDVIAGFVERVGVQIPPEQVELLKVSNGPCVGPGGIFGVRPVLQFLDIEGLYETYPAWQDAGWVPVAGDGCGNYYIAIPTGENWPVAFIDTMDDPLRPAFIVASGVLKFVIALLEKELGDTGWPFAEAQVTASDPAILAYDNVFTMPWNC